jgi:hypothetical protein
MWDVHPRNEQLPKEHTVVPPPDVWLEHTSFKAFFDERNVIDEAVALERAGLGSPEPTVVSRSVALDRGKPGAGSGKCVWYASKNGGRFVFFGVGVR